MSRSLSGVGSFSAPPAGDARFLRPVANFAALPVCGRDGNFVVVMDSLQPYVCKSGTWQPTAGSGSGASVGYNHVQSSPSTLWTIAHNLGYLPDVSTIDAGSNVVDGSISHLNPNTLTVSFNIPTSGRARCS